MPDYKKMHKEETALHVLVLAQEMTDEVYRLLTKQVTVEDANGEKKKVELFPKRTRMVTGVRLANKCDDLLDLIREANAMPTDFPITMEDRALLAFRAVAKAKSIAGQINDIQRRQKLSLDHFKNWARLYNIMMPPLKSWADSHKKGCTPMK